MSLDSPSDRWDDGDAYERFMGRWSRCVADEFVNRVAAPTGARWLDVGCGTGALLDAILNRKRPAGLVGIDPAERYLAAASRRLGGRAELRVGDGQQLPFDDHEFDVVVSGLVLNFMPDPLAAVVEMRRVTSPGGVIAAYVWDYAEGMEYLRRFWDAATSLDAAADAVDEGRRFPLCRPEPLAELLRRAGLTAVVVTAIDVPTRFTSFDDYWSPFALGQGPAPGYVAALTERRRDHLRTRLRSSLPTAADGTIRLVARAWCAEGRAPGNSPA
jgi:SAM-dependent methyltransferase